MEHPLFQSKLSFQLNNTVALIKLYTQINYSSVHLPNPMPHRMAGTTERLPQQQFEGEHQTERMLTNTPMPQGNHQQHFTSGVSFHDAVSPVISFIQFLGIMPLKGLKSHDFKTIKFAYMSFSMLSCLIFLICDLIVIVTYTIYLRVMGGVDISSASMQPNYIQISIDNYNVSHYSDSSFPLDGTSCLSWIPSFGIEVATHNYKVGEDGKQISSTSFHQQGLVDSKTKSYYDFYCNWCLVLGGACSIPRKCYLWVHC